MSSKTPTAAARKRAAKVKVKGGGDPIPLVIPIPGGLARWHKPTDLTPRQTRELEVIGAELLPRMGQLALAQQVRGPSGAVLADGSPTVFTGAPVGMSREEIRSFMEFQEACAFAYLESWTIDRELPDSPDAFQDLPRPLYNAVIEHASKLALANADQGFTVDALPDGEEEADPDLPTSPSAASPAR